MGCIAIRQKFKSRAEFRFENHSHRHSVELGVVSQNHHLGSQLQRYMEEVDRANCSDTSSINNCITGKNMIFKIKTKYPRRLRKTLTAFFL